MTYIPTTISKISTQNASVVPLAGDVGYTGTAEVVTIYSSITINIVADVSSANGGISIEFSQNKTNWDINVIDSYIGPGNYNKTFAVQAPYFRLVYTNGASDQTSFRLQCTLNSDKKSENDKGSMVKLADASYDAFARIRMSNPYTLFQVSHNTGKQNYIMAETEANGGASTYQANESCVDLSVTTTTDSEVIRQSRMYATYQPGKSLLIICTGVLNAGGANLANCISRIGLFDSENGIFFQYTGTTLSVVKRSYTSGAAVDTVVNQSDWNIDKMINGTGISGISIDVTKAQIFIIDLEWLGVGRVRCGFVVGGQILYTHQFAHANQEITVYMTRASLPIRYQITGGTTGSGTLKMICATIISEGGYESLGIPFSIGRGYNDELVTNTTLLPLISIRLNNATNRVLCKLFGLSLLAATKANCVYKLYHFLSPAVSPLTGASWTPVNTHSAMEYDIAATALDTTDGMIMNQGYLSNNVNFNASALDREINITSDIIGTSDIIVLAVQTISNNSEDIYGSVQWSEYQT